MMITLCIDNPHLPTVFNLFYDQMKDADYPYTRPLCAINEKKILLLTNKN